MVHKFERVEAIRAMRGKIWSPGRPSTARREHRVRFWGAIAGGLSSEDAAAEAGMSPAVGARWFRDAGGGGFKGSSQRCLVRENVGAR